MFWLCAPHSGVSSARGLTLGDEDLEECAAQPRAGTGGFELDHMDMHDLDFPPGSFDLVWARHVLEHSMAPLLVLLQVRNAER